MKRLIIILAVFATLGFLICSCGRSGAPANKVAAAAGTTRGAFITADSIPIRLNVKDGTASADIRKSAGEPVTVEFESGEANLLYAAITNVKDTANIRFNQITMPNGQTDGPFGRSLDYQLLQRGMYRLSIGESLMEGEPWGGVFTLNLRLSQSIPFTVGKNYFVKNSFTENTLRNSVITTREQFDAIFGRAAVMGALPTPIDFDKQYVIAIVEPMTDEAVYLDPVSIVKTGEKIVMSYERRVQDKRAYFTRPFLMVIVDKQYSGNVEIAEIRA